MARSRLEKIGTIFERVEGLLKSGAIKAEDKPIWFEVYEAHPPKLEPRYDRLAPNVPIKPIFYKEDIIRAKFQRNYKTRGVINLSTSTPTVTQQFLNIYSRIAEENTNRSEDELYETAISAFNIEKPSKQQSIENEIVQVNTSSNQESSQLSDQSKASIKDIFKD